MVKFVRSVPFTFILEANRLPTHQKPISAAAVGRYLMCSKNVVHNLTRSCGQYRQEGITQLGRISTSLKVTVKYFDLRHEYLHNNPATIRLLRQRPPLVQI